MKKNYLISFIFVLVILALVVSGTLAYWFWSTDTSQKTNTILRVANNSDQLAATLDGGENIAVNNLAPAACTNSTYSLKKTLTLTYKNLSTQAAKVYLNLTVSNFTQPHNGTLDLTKIHYALTDSTTSCASGTVIAGGNNSSFVTSGNLFTNLELLTVPANTSETSTNYYLWVWIDPSYEAWNVGSSVTDPMQDLSFKMNFSGEINNE